MVVVQSGADLLRLSTTTGRSRAPQRPHVTGMSVQQVPRLTAGIMYDWDYVCSNAVNIPHAAAVNMMYDIIKSQRIQVHKNGQEIAFFFPSLIWGQVNH